MTVALIKTKGCEGCNIMTDIFLQVVKGYAGIADITFHIYNKEDIPNVILSQIGIKDFPTVVITPLDSFIFSKEAVNAAFPTNKNEYFTILEGVVKYIDVTSAIEKWR